MRLLPDSPTTTLTRQHDETIVLTINNRLIKITNYCSIRRDLFLKEDDEELEGEVHEITGVKTVPESKIEQRDAL